MLFPVHGVQGAVPVAEKRPTGHGAAVAPPDAEAQTFNYYNAVKAVAIDPEYGRTLREAARAGVELHALSARVLHDRVRLERVLPILL